MTTKTCEYEIGGLSVAMTPAQAERWNAAETTPHDLDSITVAIPTHGNSARYITLRRATNERLEPEAARQMVGMPANPI
jgi:hypothetical protein